jgi:viroplasmin and RNaseH domain-containing protein
VPGIFCTLGECSKQVTGYKDAQFKSFVFLSEVEEYMGREYVP